MNDALPLVNFRNLVEISERKNAELEKKFDTYADYLIAETAKNVINMIHLEYHYLVFPTKTRKYSYSLPFNLEIMQKLNWRLSIKNDELKEFKWLLEKDVKTPDYRRDKLINYITSVAKTKFDAIFTGYSSDPTRDILKFETEFNANDKNMNFYFWVEEDGKIFKENKVEPPQKSSWFSFNSTKEKEDDKAKLPDLNIRKLIHNAKQAKCELEANFEKNYDKTIDILATKVAEGALKNFQNRFDNEYYFYWNEADPYLFQTGFDVKTHNNIRFALKHLNIAPLSDFPHDIYDRSNQATVDYFQTFFDRMAISTHEKLNKLMFEYTSNPSHNILKFKTTLDQYILNLNLWIDDKSNWPQIKQKSEVTLSNRSNPTKQNIFPDEIYKL